MPKQMTGDTAALSINKELAGIPEIKEKLKKLGYKTIAYDYWGYKGIRMFCLRIIRNAPDCNIDSSSIGSICIFRLISPWLYFRGKTIHGTKEIKDDRTIIYTIDELIRDYSNCQNSK